MDILAFLAFDDTGWGDEMLGGMVITLLVSVSAMAIGLIFSVFATMSKLSNNVFSRVLGNTYTTVVRGIPELLVIYLFFFGFNNALMAAAKSLFNYHEYFEFPVFLTAAIAVGIISGAYSTEVIRGSFLAVPKGQIEAAKSVGMSKFQIFHRILVPQVMRYALPGLGNVWQLTLKDTALISVMAIAEIMRTAQIAAGNTKEPFVFYIFAAILYLTLTTVSTHALNSAENWANKGVRRA